MAIEWAFLILLAVGAGIADLRPLLIVLVMAIGWVLVMLVELLAWRARPGSVVTEAVADAPVEEPPSPPLQEHVPPSYEFEFAPPATQRPRGVGAPEEAVASERAGSRIAGAASHDYGETAVPPEPLAEPEAGEGLRAPPTPAAAAPEEATAITSTEHEAPPDATAPVADAAEVPTPQASETEEHDRPALDPDDPYAPAPERDRIRQADLRVVHRLEPLKPRPKKRWFGRDRPR